MTTKTYLVHRTSKVPALDGRVADTAWAGADEPAIDELNWATDGPRPLTRARCLYDDDDALYLLFHVEDPAPNADATELNGLTFEDSSVEFFTDPNPDEASHYFNFESNCLGYFKLA